jgi:hypothetical protein
VVIGERRWEAVRAVLERFRGSHAFVILDTLNSLAPAGFDENSGRDMNAVLAAIRDLQNEFDSTVLLLHHPAKAPEGRDVGRGHGSLDGEIDGTLAFSRVGERADQHGRVVIRPKDGEEQSVDFEYVDHRLERRLVVADRGGRDSAGARRAKDVRMLTAISTGSSRVADLAVVLDQSASSIVTRAVRLREEQLVEGTGYGHPLRLTEAGFEWLAAENPSGPENPDGNPSG